MSRNGSGVYSPSATGYPAVASTTIESAKYNAVIADIATALTLSIAANGETTITANIPLAGYKITGLGNASADTDALNRVTADARYAVLTGATFTGPVIISAAVPNLLLSETGVTADNGKWALLANVEEFSICAYTDDLVTVSQPMLVTRTGTTVDSITFAGTTIALTGNGTVSGTLGVTGALTVGGSAVLTAASGAAVSSGSFTAELASASTGGSVLTTGTAYWKRIGNIVSLRLPILRATTAETAIWLRAIPAEIQPALTDTYTQTIPVFGYRNGSIDILGLQITEGSAAWLLAGFFGTFDTSNSSKGIGTANNAAPSITYQVAD